MPPDPAKALESIDLSTQNKIAMIIGATTGIGAAVARLFAKIGCSRIIIFGRNEKRAAEVMEGMRKVAKGMDFEVEFVKGDLADVVGMKAAERDLEAAAGTRRVDYLVMCQNGPPVGYFKPNADGIADMFAIQSLSRFALTYLLTSHDALAPNAVVMSICNPGISLDDLSVDNLSLEGKPYSEKYKATLAIDQSKRDSSVLDSINEEFNARYPQYRFFHVHPGLVKSELFTLDSFPFPLNWIVWLGLHTFASTPSAYANIPVYLTVSPDVAKELGTGKYFDHRLKPVVPGKWASDPKNRVALWEKLKEMIGEK